MNLDFKEEQKFNQWWLWLILIGLGALSVAGIYKRLILGEPLGENPMSDVQLIFFAALNLGVIFLFWLMRLTTQIDQEKIRISLIPFYKKDVYWKDVKSAVIVQYETGLGNKYGTPYRISGKTGLAIELKNGRKLVIGTQQEDELKTIIARHMS